jgi:hypothetical protein
MTQSRALLLRARLMAALATLVSACTDPDANAPNVR